MVVSYTLWALLVQIPVVYFIGWSWALVLAPFVGSAAILLIAIMRHWFNLGPPEPPSRRRPVSRPLTGRLS